MMRAIIGLSIGLYFHGAIDCVLFHGDDVRSDNYRCTIPLGVIIPHTQTCDAAARFTVCHDLADTWIARAQLFDNQCGCARLCSFWKPSLCKLTRVRICMPEANFYVNAV